MSLLAPRDLPFSVHGYRCRVLREGRGRHGYEVERAGNVVLCGFNYPTAAGARAALLRELPELFHLQPPAAWMRARRRL